MCRAGLALAQIALFGEQHKLAYAIERALNRKSKPDWTVIAQEIQNCQTATLRIRAGTVAAPAMIRPISVRRAGSS